MMPIKLVTRLLRGFFGFLLVLATLLAVHVLLAVVLVKIAQRNKRLRARVLKPYNAVILRIAGRRFSPYALLKHVGRGSGRDYVTPLGAYPFGDGFALGLTYGPGVDWCRNVMTVGYATLKWHGHEYALERPEIIPASQVLVAYPLPIRSLIRAEKYQCLWLHRQSDDLEHDGSEKNRVGVSVQIP